MEVFLYFQNRKKYVTWKVPQILNVHNFDMTASIINHNIYNINRHTEGNVFLHLMYYQCQNAMMGIVSSFKLIFHLIEYAIN